LVHHRDHLACHNIKAELGVRVLFHPSLSLSLIPAKIATLTPITN
jgi:hypothetical protein